MIRDKDAVVVSNCILALNEILADEGGIAVNQAMIYHLLNRLKEFNEWTTCVILEATGKYVPTEEEVYDILVRTEPLVVAPGILNRSPEHPRRSVEACQYRRRFRYRKAVHEVYGDSTTYASR